MNAYGIIYIYTNRINGKKYVGQTVQTMAHRHNDHVQDARRGRTNMPFHRALVKYGKENFDCDILVVAFDRESLSYLEAQFIQVYGTMDKTKGYNLTSGGLHGRLAPEVKAKIGEASKQHWTQPGYREHMASLPKNVNGLKTPETIAKRAQKMKGRSATHNQLSNLASGRLFAQTAESRAKASATRKARPLTLKEVVREESKKRAIIGIHEADGQITQFDSFKAAYAVGHVFVGIKKALRSGQPYHGITWRYA